MDKLSRRTFVAGSALALAGVRPSFAQAVDMAAAKKEGKVVWYCSVPVATAQKVANLFEQKIGADHRPLGYRLEIGRRRFRQIEQVPRALIRLKQRFDGGAQIAVFAAGALEIACPLTGALDLERLCKNGLFRQRGLGHVSHSRRTRVRHRMPPRSTMRRRTEKLPKKWTL